MFMLSKSCVIKYLSERQEDFDESIGSEEWNIQPPALTLHPPHLPSMTAVLRSNGSRRHPFEAVVVELSVKCTPTDMPLTSHPRFWKGVVKV
jgi:hypothetical protein